MPVRSGFGFDNPAVPPNGGAHHPSAPSSAAAAAAAAAKRRKTPEFTDSEDEDQYSSMDEDAVKEALRPAKKHLKKLKTGTDDLGRDEKIAVLKECVAGIGARVDEIVAEKKAQGEDANKWKKHCWVFASFFWPRRGVNYVKLMDIHSKLVSLHCCGSVVAIDVGRHDEGHEGGKLTNRQMIPHLSLARSLGRASGRSEFCTYSHVSRMGPLHVYMLSILIGNRTLHLQSISTMR
jgi:chromodomain-helicase-DNA-binding protein 1